MHQHHTYYLSSVSLKNICIQVEGSIITIRNTTVSLREFLKYSAKLCCVNANYAIRFIRKYSQVQQMVRWCHTDVDHYNWC